jgi:hypothetical protein
LFLKRAAGEAPKKDFPFSLREKGQGMRVESSLEHPVTTNIFEIYPEANWVLTISEKMCYNIYTTDPYPLKEVPPTSSGFSSLTFSNSPHSSG